MSTETSNAPRQICLVFSLHPGAEGEYDRRHRTVWPELLEECRSAGMTEITVYRLGTSVVVLLSHPHDAAAALARIGASEAARRWNDSFADLMATQPTAATEVWRLNSAEGPSA